MDNFDDNPLDPGVSAVVCCYNSSEVIAPTIAALSKQEVPPEVGYEVILVDNNCTDDTVQLAKNAWKDGPYPLRVVEEKECGLIHARKAGVRSARYDILLFVDDDNILNPDWVIKLRKLYGEMPKVGIIGGYNEALVHGQKPAWFDRYQGVYACGPRDERSGLHPRKRFGAGLSFRTELIKSVLFSRLPLFLVGKTQNKLRRGEDTEIVIRCLLMGWDFYYDESLKLRHNLLPERIDWHYVCEARKGGGTASIILKMYWDLLDGKKPMSFQKLVIFVLKEWKRYLLTNKASLYHTKKEVSEGSLTLFRLLGMSRGLFVYRNSYQNIRRQLIGYFL